MPQAGVALRQAFRGRLCPPVVEAHSIDNRLVRGQPKQTRHGVSGLWTGGQGAYFHMTKAQCEKTPNRFGILIQAGRDSNRMGKFEPHRMYWVLCNGSDPHSK